MRDDSGSKATQKKVMPFNTFIDRIRKSLYFGCDATVEEMVESSHPLSQYASEIFSESHKGHSLNRLNTVAAGSVHATPCSLIMALIYLDRINLSDPGYVRRITPQELFIVSMMISTKFYAGHDEDEEFYLCDWADDGHMTEKRLKQLELDFLCAIEWNLYISNEQFFNKLSHVERTLARREGLRRGWLTYTELMQMLPTFTLVKFLLNNVTVMAISYAASVMTIAGAFFLASQIPGTALHRKATPATLIVPVESTLEQADIIMPADGTVDIDGRTELNATEATAVTIAISKRNATCSALNVELELRQLERHYREEAKVEEARHELVANRLAKARAVPGPLGGATWQRRRQQQQDTKLNWLTWMEQFSEGIKTTPQTMPAAKQADTKGHKGLSAYVDGWYNGTHSLFWQLFGSDVTTEHLLLMRLPWSWFKFI